MTDEAYLFKQDVREKAITARSSHKVGSSRRRKCRFSSDRLTKKEWEKLNGPIHTITPGAAMTWEAFKAVPDTLQKKYIEGILEKYKVGPNAIARMFGISGTYCGNYLRGLGFSFSGHTTPSETARFLRDYGKTEEVETESGADKKKHGARTSLADILRRIFARDDRCQVSRPFRPRAGSHCYS